MTLDGTPSTPFRGNHSDRESSGVAINNDSHNKHLVRAAGLKPARLAATADAIAIGLAFTTAFAVRFLQPAGTRELLPYFTAVTSLVIGIWVTALAFTGAYRWSTVANGITDTSAVIRASIIAFATTATLSYIFKAEVSRIFILVAFPLGTLLLVLGRRIIRNHLYKTRNRNPITTPVLLVQREDRPSDISQVLSKSDDLVFDRIYTFEASDELIAIGNFTDKLIAATEETQAGRLILDQGLALSNGQIAELSWELDQRNIELLVVPEFLGVWASRLELIRHDSLPLIELVEPRLSPLRQSHKRVVDLVLTIPAFILITPVYIIIGLLVALTSPGPILFIQPRIGVEGKAFPFYKFRTMRDGADKERLDVLGRPDEEMAERYKRDPRITPIGRVLRRFSLDELPQLWNVIRGDMSLVGPRPMLEEEVAQLEENHQRRHLIKPGLTGLWQISGRKETSWEERMLLDLYYIDQWSISTDLAIILKTFKVVADGKGGW